MSIAKANIFSYTAASNPYFVKSLAHKYGYEFDKNIGYDWDLKSQKLNYRMCLDIANKFITLRQPMNKISGFYIPAALSTGISLDDIYNLTEEEIKKAAGK